MANADAYLKSVSKVLADELGEQTGELFYTSYQGKDKTEIIKDARTLLADLLGPQMAITRISEVNLGKEKREK